MRRASSESDLFPLVEAAYTSATQPEAWQTFLSILSETAGSDVSVLHLYDQESAQGSVTWSSGMPPGLVAEYSSWASKNPHVGAVMTEMHTGFLLPNTRVPRAEYERSEYFNEFMRLHLPLYGTCGCCIYTDGVRSLFLATDRVVSRPAFDSREADLLLALLPHVQRAMALHRRLAEADLERMTGLDLLNRLEFGVVLLSDRGRLTVANDAAHHFLRSGDALTLSADGRVTTALSTSRSELSALVDSACGSRIESLRPLGGAMRVQSKRGTASLEVVVSTLRLREVAFASQPPRAVMFIRDPDVSVPPLARLQQLFGLTVAEGRVAQLLASGLSVQELADALHVELTTARTHVRRLIVKTGSRSISDLTRRLVGFPLRRN